MGRRRGRRTSAPSGVAGSEGSAARAPVLAIASALVLALAAAGCGVEEHVNDPRPQPPTRVSVTVTDDAVTVTPSRIAIGPEPTQQIPQNRNAGQPTVRSDAPLTVAFVASNLTDTDARLRVRGMDRDETSKPWVGHGNVTLQAGLPTGVYRLSAPGIPGAEPARLLVGPVRTSSENDLLLP